MSIQYSPAIVCLGYNRPDSLMRLLNSLLAAHYANATVPLVISLDHSGNSKCLDLANAFLWPHGPKRVIAHPTRLGLVNHVLYCGDLSSEFGSLIMLEDDLVVATSFYAYASQALNYYAADSRIAGISLYTRAFNFQARMPFCPVPTAFESFFLQFPCSWGQAWTHLQWQGFRSWLNLKGNQAIHPHLPKVVSRWPDSSWMKRAAGYLLESGKTWVYPYKSYSTNSGEAGFNTTQGSTLNQAPLIMGLQTNFNFAILDQSSASYDLYFENRSPLFCADLSVPADQIELDLYGCKPVQAMHKPYVITSKSCQKSLAQFGVSYKPWEQNIRHKQMGSAFNLCAVAHVQNHIPSLKHSTIQFLHPNRLSVQEVLRWAFKSLLWRLKKIIIPRHL